MKWAVLTAIACAVAFPVGAEEAHGKLKLGGSVSATQGLQIGSLAQSRSTRQSTAIAILTATAANQTASSGTK